MMAKTPSLNASIRVVGILPTLNSLYIRRKVSLFCPTQLQTTSLPSVSGAPGAECAGPRAFTTTAGSVASMPERAMHDSSLELLQNWMQRVAPSSIGILVLQLNDAAGGGCIPCWC